MKQRSSKEKNLQLLVLSEAEMGTNVPIVKLSERLCNYNLQMKLDVDPRNADDAFPMSSYGCMFRPTCMFKDRMIAPINMHNIS